VTNVPRDLGSGGRLLRVGSRLARSIHGDERGQSLVIVLGLITFLFLMGSAMAAHVSVALRSTAAGDAQADAFHAADAGAELGIWWQRNGKTGNPPPISVNGTTVTTAISTAGGSTCATPTPIRLTGFEHGSVSSAGAGLFSAVTGNGSSADATDSRSGDWSLRIADPNGSRHFVTLATTGPVVVARVYLRLDALPSADVTELLVMDAAAGNDLRLGYRASTQRLTLRFGSLAVTPATVAISAGSWVRVDLRLTANANPRTADWQLDGVAQPSISAGGTASTVQFLRLGSNVNADVYVANYDDVFASVTDTDYPIGDGSIEAIRPDGMGASATPGSFRNSDGSAIDGSTWQRLDDDPLAGTADHVYQQTTGAAAHVETTLGDTSATCITGASGVVAYRSASSAANNGATTVFDGSTEFTIFQGDMSEVALTYRSAILARPGGWTAAALNGLVARIGKSTDVSPNPYWDGILLEVATGSGGSPATVTVTATGGGSTVVTTYLDAGAAAPTLLSWTADR